MATLDNYKMSEYFEKDKTSDNHLIYAATLKFAVLVLE